MTFRDISCVVDLKIYMYGFFLFYLETANKLYEACDNVEYEMSSTRLDLRFVPDDFVFEHEPKSVATELPCIKSYEPST